MVLVTFSILSNWPKELVDGLILRLRIVGAFTGELLREALIQAGAGGLVDGEEFKFSSRWENDLLEPEE